MKSRKPAYLLRVSDEVASLIRGLHPLIKSHLRSAFATILEDPFCGKSLKEELHGLKSYRVKRYRIIYRIVRKKKELEIIAIGPRRNIYEETFKIISKEETKQP
ncbi:MAG: type II toxin-antitoxin system RelE/ParE family toxin [Desulfobulbaceae bacterium]|nr:type II toxin-antitoxin system RelE/ParE family toxin [Desulfobulbaceae bacterium]